jgi:two-component system, LuxR family, sensor kinase FixL
VPSALTLLLAAVVVQLMLIVVLLTQWQRGRRSLHRLEQQRAGATARTGELVHELNQPLTAILSNAQAAQRFLAAGHLDVQELREILSDIVMDDKRAAGIVKSLRSTIEETKVSENS